MEGWGADGSVAIQTSNGICRTVGRYLIVRVGNDAGGLDGVGALLGRAKLIVLLVVEQSC